MSVTIPAISQCPRCLMTHAPQGVEQLTRPAVIAGERFTHWMTCPSNGEPVFIRVSLMSFA